MCKMVRGTVEDCAAETAGNVNTKDNIGIIGITGILEFNNPLQILTKLNLMNGSPHCFCSNAFRKVSMSFWISKFSDLHHFQITAKNRHIGQIK